MHMERPHVLRRPQFVAVLPKRKLVLMGRIGKTDPVCCVRSIWALLGLGWSRWELLIKSRALDVEVEPWPGKDNHGQRTVLVLWHRVPWLLEALRFDVERHAKHQAVADLQSLMVNWPGKHLLSGNSQLVTRVAEQVHGKTAVEAKNAPEALKIEVPVLQPKPGRVKILRSVHKPEVLRLLNEGLNTVQIAKTMGISRPAVSQIINDTYAYRHD